MARLQTNYTLTLDHFNCGAYKDTNTNLAQRQVLASK